MTLRRGSFSIKFAIFAFKSSSAQKSVLACRAMMSYSLNPKSVDRYIPDSCQEFAGPSHCVIELDMNMYLDLDASTGLLAEVERGKL